MRQHKPPDCPVIPGEMANTKLGAQLIVRESVPELAEALIHKCAGEDVYTRKVADDRLAVLENFFEAGAQQACGLPLSKDSSTAPSGHVEVNEGGIRHSVSPSFRKDHSTTRPGL